MVSQGYPCGNSHYSLVRLFSRGSEVQERRLDYNGIYSLRQLQEATGAHASPVAALKTLISRGFLTLRLRWGRHGHRQGYHRPQGFCEELQVLWSESRNCHSIDVPDILGTWSLADLCDVAWFATVEAETMTRVSLHQMGAIQVHGLGD